MGEVVKLRRPRRETVRGVAREILSDAMRSVSTAPSAVVVVVLGADGSFAYRTAAEEGCQQFDVLSRAGAVIERERLALLESD